MKMLNYKTASSRMVKIDISSALSGILGEWIRARIRACEAMSLEALRSACKELRILGGYGWLNSAFESMRNWRRPAEAERSLI